MVLSVLVESLLGCFCSIVRCAVHMNPVEDITTSLLTLYFSEAALMSVVSAFTLSGRLKHRGMKARQCLLSFSTQVNRVPGVTFKKIWQFIVTIIACNSGKCLSTWSIFNMFTAGCMKHNFSGFLASECAKSKKELLRRKHKCTRATERGQLHQLLF